MNITISGRDVQLNQVSSIKKEIGDASPELRDIIEENNGIRLLNSGFL